MPSHLIDRHVPEPRKRIDVNATIVQIDLSEADRTLGGFDGYCRDRLFKPVILKIKETYRLASFFVIAKIDCPQHGPENQFVVRFFGSRNQRSVANSLIPQLFFVVYEIGSIGFSNQPYCRESRRYPHEKAWEFLKALRGRMRKRVGSCWSICPKKNSSIVYQNRAFFQIFPMPSSICSSVSDFMLFPWVISGNIL